MGVTRNLVLGGSGTVGRALVNRLRNAGEEVTNVDIKVGYDLRVRDLEEFSEVDYVWFLAWDVGGSKFLTSEKYQLDIIRNNTAICLNVFRFLELHRIPFLFASSQLAAPDNTYGITKLLGENWTKQLGGTIVKFWNVYGWEEPGDKSHVIPDLIMQALVKKHIRTLTTGEEERQFIFMDDCVDNLMRIRSMSDKEINMTNGQWIKIKELATIIADKLNVSVTAGEKSGYNNRIDPGYIPKEFTFPTTLSVGIDVLIESAKAYINSQK